MKSEPPRETWCRMARRLARRMNVGFWLADFLPLFFAAGLVQAFLLIWLRKNQLPTSPAWWVFAALLLAAGSVAWFRKRKRFFSQQDALVFLETRLGLNNGLTAADTGVAGWPKPVALPARIVPRWSWKRIGPWPAWTLAIMAVAAWLPVDPVTSSPSARPVEPIAWSGIESRIETLEETDILEPASLEDFRQRVEELRRRAPRDWYSHSSLEATDSLEERTERAIRDLRDNLETTARALAEAEAFPEGLPWGREAALREELREALAGFEEGLLQLDPEFLAQLSELDPQSLPSMSQEELDALRECLADGLAACEASLGDGEDVLLARVPGTGGIGEGPAPAPLSFRADPATGEVSRLESVSNDDLSRAALGDRIGVGETDDDDEKRAPYRGPARAGTIATPGDGGEAVPRETFTPDEQAVLERYFR